MTHADWHSLYEVSIRSRSAGAIEAGRWASERLLEIDGVPAVVRQQVRATQVWSAQRLSDIVASTRLKHIRFPIPTRWSRFNPSIAVTGAGYAMIVRSSNYVYDGSSIVLLDDEQVIRTKNYFLSLSTSFAVESVGEIREDVDSVQTYPSSVVGLEDCRLFCYQRTWYTSATTRDRNPLGICQVALARIGNCTFRDLSLLSRAAEGRHEKNWMPFVVGDRLLFIYSCRPIVILEYDQRERRVMELVRKCGPVIGHDFRGGSQVVTLDDSLLFVVHEAILSPSMRRVYLHRFVLIPSPAEDVIK